MWLASCTHYQLYNTEFHFARKEIGCPQHNKSFQNLMKTVFGSFSKDVQEALWVKREQLRPNELKYLQAFLQTPRIQTRPNYELMKFK